MRENLKAFDYTRILFFCYKSPGLRAPNCLYTRRS